MSLYRVSMDDVSREEALDALHHLPNSAGMSSKIVFSRPGIKSPDSTVDANVQYLKGCYAAQISPTGIKIRYDT